MDLLSDLIIEPNIAPIKYRVRASVIDLLVLWLVFYVIAHFYGESYVENGVAGVRLTGLPAFAYFAIFFGLMPLQEGLTGHTIGKRIMKIKVLKEDLSDNSVGRSIVRHLFDIVDLFCFLGLIVAASRQKKQRVGDPGCKNDSSY